MKRFIAVLLIICCLCSSALANRFDFFHIEFDAAAYYAGVHEIDETLTHEMSSVYSEDDTYWIGFGDYEMAVTFIGEDVSSVYVALKNKEAEADFLLTCLAVVITLGGIDYTTMGSLLDQLAFARNGKKQYPAVIGQDTFLLSPSEDFVYSFTYLNNDRKFRK